MDKISCVDRVSEYPGGSREWWRDWSAYWMREAQGAARLSNELRTVVGWQDLAEQWRRISIGHLRHSLQDYKRSLDAPDESKLPGHQL